MPRLLVPTVLMAIVALLVPTFHDAYGSRTRRVARSFGWLLLLGVFAALLGSFRMHDVIRPDSAGLMSPFVSVTREAAASATEPGIDWRTYGRTTGGTRFAALDQIHRDNVDQLKVAWTYRTGEKTGNPGGIENQNIPIQVGDGLYLCTGDNVVHALDAETGKPRWIFGPKMVSPLPWQRCRGVSYHESADSGSSCPQRIVMATGDARLWAIDAKTGTPCADFGANGSVNLRENICSRLQVFYTHTSAPLIADDLVVVGGMVVDNQSIGEPSGVIRAFHAVSGRLVWAWDLGRPATTTLPPPGQTYTEGTPNAWSTLSFDKQLGLVYVPLGNATPDYWGAVRSPEMEAYTDALVALEVETVRERWKFQTAHHDLWDYDLAAQPALYDVPDGKGGTLPAVVQATKTGQLYVLDRRNGKPITQVEGKPVPQGGVAPGEKKLSPTQPFSTGMPAIGNETLIEADMWGATMFDQLICRIAFRKLRYEGMYTPLGTTPSLGYPRNYGGFNWEVWRSMPAITT